MNKQNYSSFGIAIALVFTTSLPLPTMANGIPSSQGQVSNLTTNNYLEVGKQEYTAHHYQNALVAFHQAIQGNDNQAEAYYWRGKALVALEERQLAIADFKSATCKAADEGNISIYNQALSEYNTLNEAQ